MTTGAGSPLPWEPAPLLELPDVQPEVVYTLADVQRRIRRRLRFCLVGTMTKKSWRKLPVGVQFDDTTVRGVGQEYPQALEALAEALDQARAITVYRRACDGSHYDPHTFRFDGPITVPFHEPVDIQPPTSMQEKLRMGWWGDFQSRPELFGGRWLQERSLELARGKNRDR